LGDKNYPKKLPLAGVIFWGLKRAPHLRDTHMEMKYIGKPPAIAYVQFKRVNVLKCSKMFVFQRVSEQVKDLYKWILKATLGDQQMEGLKHVYNSKYRPWWCFLSIK